VATEAAWLKGKQFGKRRNKEKKENNKNERKALTLTGLLMEGVCPFDGYLIFDNFRDGMRRPAPVGMR